MSPPVLPAPLNCVSDFDATVACRNAFAAVAAKHGEALNVDKFNEFMTKYLQSKASAITLRQLFRVFDTGKRAAEPS